MYGEPGMSRYGRYSFYSGPNGTAVVRWSRWFLLLVLAVYLAGSVFCDIVTSRLSLLHKGQFAFNVLAVLIVEETGKLVISFFLMVRERRKGVKLQISKRDLILNAIPGLMHAVTEVFYFKAITKVDLTSWSVLTQSRILFVAWIWRLVFKEAISPLRWLAMFGVFVGCILDRFHPESTNWHTAAFPVFYAFLVAVCPVLSEFVMKKSEQLDVLIQSSVYYLSSLIVFVIWAAMKHDLKRGFFHGIWEKHVLMLIAAKVVVCLIYPRVLKYTNALTQTIVSSLRGPTAIILGPLFVNTKADLHSYISAAIVFASSALYGYVGTKQQQKGDWQESFNFSQEDLEKFGLMSAYAEKKKPEASAGSQRPQQSARNFGYFEDDPDL